MKVVDFSDETRAMYNDCKKQKISLSELIDRFLDCDYEFCEIKKFIKSKFGNDFGLCDSRLEYLKSN